MRIVQCIDQKHYNLTTGEYYHIIKEGGSCCIIKNDLGINQVYSTDLFNKTRYEHI